MRPLRFAFTALVAISLGGCVLRGLFPFGSMREVKGKIERPVRSDARLAVLWVGHATVLLQLDDKIILTDPVFTSTVGQLSKRLVEPGLDARNVPKVDAVLISHLHFDHLSLGTLTMLEDRLHRVYLPEGGAVYVPDSRFPTTEVRSWQSFDEDGLTVTAVPVRHVGWRYGVDQAWMKRSFTGYVIEYHGLTVYYGGDTGFEPNNFRAASERFPHIDLALLPIAPVNPRSLMEETHEDPDEAVAAFLMLGARWMVPIHYDTFINSFDAPGEALDHLARAMRARAVGPERIAVLAIGEQRVFIPR